MEGDLGQRLKSEQSVVCDFVCGIMVISTTNIVKTMRMMNNISGSNGHS